MARVLILGVILCSLLANPVCAQSGEYLTFSSASSIRQQADNYFERQAYSHAAKLYTRITTNHPDDHQVILLLADCYRFMREPYHAARWYKLALEKKPTIAAEHYFNYASALCATGKYQLALTWFSRYLELQPEDKRAIAAIESLTSPELIIDGTVEVEEVPIELPGGVFSPAIFDGGLVFVGEGATGSLTKKVTTWIEGSYFDLYYVPLDNGKPGFPRYLDNKLNSVFHEGPVTFFDRGNKVIITRSAFKKGQGDTRNLQLMISERKPGGNWSTPKKLFHQRDYSIGHPAITADAGIIYFASNKPGGYGGSDLYFSEYENGKWTEPVNMGPQINTSGNELFPTIGGDGLLYFSSDGHGGLGALDIFKTEPSAGAPPVHLGYPINSPRDDFSMVFETNASHGYFSTNRSGQDRIYRFEMKPQLVKAAVPVN